MLYVEGMEHDRSDLCPDYEENFPGDMPDPRTKPVNITTYFDADHASYLVTCHFVTGAHVYVNSNRINWYCKR